MPIALPTVVIGILFYLAYSIYGRRLARRFDLDDSRITPAVRMEDGYDYVPTNKAVLLAQHFASIAAAGPVVGPIAAGLAFGWGPTLVWILFGCIFIGACHDFSSLVASVRNDAKSVPEIAKSLLGPVGYRLSLGFIWLCLVYVIIAFTDVTAQQFVAREEWGGVMHDLGGGVATSSILYLLLSVIFGVLTTKLNLSLTWATLIFFPLLLLIIALGQSYPLILPTSAPITAWCLLILAYCAVASLLPLWLLLQPRGYLGGYFLYAILAIGALGLVFGGFSIQYPISTGFFSPKGESLYPFLFITVACGACSGFHGLVCSGTTSKQLKHESHAPLVGYGGMLLEGVVAVMALSTVMIWPAGTSTLGKSPAEIYATGIAHFSNAIFGLDLRWGVTFGMLAFATFVYDTLDVATRLGRYLLEELFDWKDRRGKLAATGLTLGLPVAYVLFASSRTTPLWAIIWPLFGSSNQLMAALTLILMSLWLKKLGQRSAWLLWPAAFMFVTATSALAMQVWQAANILGSGFNGPALLTLVVSGGLSLLSVAFAVSCFRGYRALV